MGLITFLLIPYIVRKEVLQFLAEKEKFSYFKNFWKIVDLIAIALTTILTINWLFGWILE